VSEVKLLAKWTGWCDPCETERPLLLTRTGEHGLRAWLRGVGDEDRALRLTCRVCGEWQDVAWDEEDVEETVVVVPEATIIALHTVGAQQVTVARRSVAAYPLEALPAARVAPAVEYDAPSDEALLDLLEGGVDLISKAS
jgi:hypothetical protein